MLIGKIKKAELSTVEYTVRQVVRHSDVANLLGNRKALFTCKATIKAGIDLDELTDEDVRINGTSIAVTLPAPKIMSFKMNRNDALMVYSNVSTLRKDFSQQEVTQILSEGEKEIRNNKELNEKILSDARSNAEEFMEILLAQSGFTRVKITFSEK